MKGKICHCVRYEARSKAFRIAGIGDGGTLKLPASHIPANYPYGNDLDNLLKRFCDALKQTVLRHAPGDDSAIISLSAAKAIVKSKRDAGADFELIEIETTCPGSSGAARRLH